MNSGKSSSTSIQAEGNIHPKVTSSSAPAEPQAKELKGIGNGEFSGKKAILTIAASKEDGGNEAVFVSPHGVAFQIPRGKPCLVPIEVVNVLRDAVETTYVRQIVDGKEIVVPVESPRYTFVSQEAAAPADK